MHSAHEGKHPQHFWAPHLAGFNKLQGWFLCLLHGNPGPKPLFTVFTPELLSPQLILQHAQMLE